MDLEREFQSMGSWRSKIYPKGEGRGIVRVQSMLWASRGLERARDSTVPELWENKEC